MVCVTYHHSLGLIGGQQHQGVSRQLTIIRWMYRRAADRRRVHGSQVIVEKFDDPDTDFSAGFRFIFATP